MDNETKRWRVLRSQTRTQVFVGVNAKSAEGAVEKYWAGEGELANDLERWSEWQLEVEPDDDR